MKFREFDEYRSYYCGLCRVLKEKYGISGQITLSFDLTFLILLLTGLYEPTTKQSCCTCVAHPFEKHPTSINEFTHYVADMNVLLSYYKCLDDWSDEHKFSRLSLSKALKCSSEKIKRSYPQKAKVISTMLDNIHLCEKNKEDNVDIIAGYFGTIMSELFVYRTDEWEESLRKIGFFMGKFIYLMDAYEDIEKDMKENNYNPFIDQYQQPEFLENCRKILTMMMAECSKEFEKLPILQHAEIIRNIIYSGVWCRFEQVSQKRKDKNNV
jgi:hypothetical protein